MRALRRLVMAGLLLAAGSSALFGAKNNPSVALRFVPQQTVAAASATLVPEMMDRAVALHVRDRRPGSDPTRIGTRTDDDDRTHVLKATTDVVAFVDETARRVLAEWGLQVDPDASRVVELTLMSFQVTEVNQAVGATFSAEVRFSGEIQDSSARRLATANVFGDASRYGKKFSNENVNEVLSDALLEALAGFVSEGAVQTAWAGDSPTPLAAPDSRDDTARASTARGSSARDASRDATARAPLAPAALLAEIRRLMGQGLSTETIRSYVSQQVLSRALSADDLAAWKDAGVPEPILQTALACKVL